MKGNCSYQLVSLSSPPRLPRRRAGSEAEENVKWKMEKWGREEGWRVGGLEGWKAGFRPTHYALRTTEDWRSGGLEGWVSPYALRPTEDGKMGRLEDWKVGSSILIMAIQWPKLPEIHPLLVGVTSERSGEVPQKVGPCRSSLATNQAPTA